MTTYKQSTNAPALLKLLAAYLVAVLMLQGLAAAFAMGAGPLHRHRVVPASSPTATLFVHPADRALAFAPQSAHHHSANERHHHHAGGDPTVALDAAAEEAADGAALALSAALSLLAVQTPRVQTESRSHVLRAAIPWFWRSRLTLPLARPPSQG